MDFGEDLVMHDGARWWSGGSGGGVGMIWSFGFNGGGVFRRARFLNMVASVGFCDAWVLGMVVIGGSLWWPG